ncbi:FAD-dependent oxidoreductase [Oceanobacillus neutriphilus]|uniref:Pyridine nucleotide-disulfide oxidoreductase n=1 Tax=Oceanobacillus neutriphilus TaxID=531815 RepID=A0ABQ2NNE7_9BACI|nr:FAD-dependent oxidoreductase [Oceanobacillus neutriphilus]GGP07787.1 pyridine nucleotide-disulfide oxidoreductase [Oceanobacillus neutriphilus]
MTDEVKQNKTISIEIDGEEYQIPKGYTLAAAVTYAKSLAYRKTRFGDVRGPVCNMGVCMECSVFLQGRGSVRACMIRVKDGMRVWTAPDFTRHLDDGNAQVEPISESNPENNEYDVVVIGAGPAGMAAAEELSGNGLHIALIDEQENIGGQIYRHIPNSIKKVLPNDLVKRSSKLADVQFISGNAVWSVVATNKEGKEDMLLHKQAKYEIHLDHHQSIFAKYIIIASGAYDKMIPFKGWTKPGVMSAGGLQVFAKTQHFIPGESILLAGSHPFLLIVAKQILEQGGSITGIAFSQSFPRIHELLPMGVSGLKRWKKSLELIDALQTVRKAGVPIWFHTVPLEAKGTDRVQSVVLNDLGKTGKMESNSWEVECDLAGICYGFHASSEIPRQLSCQMKYNALAGGWLAEVNENMQSSLKGIYAAGELTGVGGAELSEIEGRIAGNSILENIFNGDVDRRKLDRLKKERESWMSFAELLGKMTRMTFDSMQLLKKHPDTFVCRCEEVTYEAIDEILQAHPHLSTMNAVKLMTRCGMGLCQGRYCETTLRDMLKQTGISEEADAFSARFPVKPTVIGSMKD